MKTSIAILLVVLPAAAAAPGRGKYQPSWESLKQHPVPRWFRDAKFGIYFHWGVYSVPAYHTEWYSRNMYIEKHRVYKYHVRKYGHPLKFGYKDFIPMFKAEKFDPEGWADLFVKAGAKFAGPVAEHADGFAMWDSALTKWDAADVGPKRDIAGELEKSIRKRGMKFIMTFHHGWNWGWYPTSDKRYDSSDPKYAGLYGFPFGPGSDARKVTNPAFFKEWQGKVTEVIDKYKPDFLWFDSKLGIIDAKVRRDLLAYYYNKEARWRRQVGVSYKRTDLPEGAGILDLERGRMGKLTRFVWLTDTSICRRSWCHVQNPDYMSVDRMVDTLVDIVSKNGVLLLNIPPRADGVIPPPVVERLEAMGQWLRINGEAIYGTRPWVVFGEGPTKVKGGMFGDRKIGQFTARDVRFTTKGKVLYAIVLAWPESGQVTIGSLKADGRLYKGKIVGVQLLGATEPVKWSQDAVGLRVKLPSNKPCHSAFVLKITPSEE